MLSPQQIPASLWVHTHLPHLEAHSVHPEFFGGMEPWLVRAETSLITHPSLLSLPVSPSSTFIVLLLITFQINHLSQILISGSAPGEPSLRQYNNDNNCHLSNIYSVPGIRYICPRVILITTLASGHYHLYITVEAAQIQGEVACPIHKGDPIPAPHRTGCQGTWIPTVGGGGRSHPEKR